MLELATEAATSIPDASGAAYRDRHAPAHAAPLRRRPAAADDRHAPDAQASVAALALLLAGELEITEDELVTPSDVARVFDRDRTTVRGHRRHR